MSKHPLLDANSLGLDLTVQPFLFLITFCNGSGIIRRKGGEMKIAIVVIIILVVGLLLCKKFCKSCCKTDKKE